jgi:archaemetzincin
MILFCGCSETKKRKGDLLLALQPYKGFDTSLNTFIKKETEQFYQCRVIVFEPVQLPSSAFYPPRNRYRADSLLDFEKKLVPDSVEAIAGLTDKDISTTNGNIPDWGVFGLGFNPGKACVISTYRLQSTTAKQFRERLIKVVLHEFGHNLGLPHCKNNPECLMTDAEGTMSQVDREKKWICEKCQIKLKG